MSVRSLKIKFFPDLLNFYNPCIYAKEYLTYSVNRRVYYDICRTLVVCLLLKVYFGLPISPLTSADRGNMRFWTISEIRLCFDRNNYVHTIWIQTECYVQCFMFRNIYVRGGQLQMLHLFQEAKRFVCVRNRQISSNLPGPLKTVLGLILSWYII